VNSIRSFLLSRLLGGTTLVLAAAGALVYTFLARSLEAQFDRNLADRVQGFASILFQTADEVEFEFSGELMPEYERADAPAYFQLSFADGSLLERSDSLGGQSLFIPLDVSHEPAHWSAPLPDGRPGRFVAQWIEVHHVYPEEGPDRPAAAQVQVVLARGREELFAAERDVLAACAVVGLGLLALIAVLSWQAVERGLEPAKRLAAGLDAIRAEALPERLGVGALPAELRPMAATIDALLQRVEAAFQRERRTTADIAHELRTPISELRIVSEVALREVREDGESRRALGTVRDVAWRMGRSVETLLKLARLEMGAETFGRDRVDLSLLLREELRALAALERERELVVENRVEPDDSVAADADVLRIVVSNLLGNALYYAPPGTRVDLRFERFPSGWRLVFANEAGELREEDLATLVQPFWRKDRARADRTRSGLGLALSCALVELAGLELTFELEGGRFLAVLAQPEAAGVPVDSGGNGRP